MPKRDRDRPDVLVIGGTPGGCAAAIAAARSGCSVTLLEPTPTLGGITANGVFAFDSASPRALSAIAHEFGDLVRAHYRSIGHDDPLFHRRADQVWESHVAALVWRQMTERTSGLCVIRGAVPIAVVAHERELREVHWVPAVDAFGNPAPHGTVPEVVRARRVIDASYEADVAAWAGIPFSIGREARSWREPHAGRIYTSNMTHSPRGHLPNTVLPESSGAPDDAIMAFACRLQCRYFEDASPAAKHRLKQPPSGYDPANYAWHPVGTKRDGSPDYFGTIFVLVNGKYLLNRMVRGNNLAAPGRDYILAHPKDRGPIRQRYVDHALGFLYFVQTEGGLPQLGLATDEFVDNDNIPCQIYVREGRRIHGLARLDEADITPYIAGDGIRPPPRADAIAICDWTIESHGCADRVEPGCNQPEGWVMNRVTRAPFQVPYGCLVPQDIDNLLVCGAVSSSHIAFSALRVESVRMQNGLAAGIAAALSLELDCAPINVPVERIQQEVLARGGKLTFLDDVEADHPQFRAIQWAALRGLTPPDRAWRFHPEQPVNWGELVRSVVIALRLPISVSGAHFDRIDPRHPCFPWLESLYDLGTRADVDFFDANQLQDEDPLA
ncbi:MAG: FAD-dependent oxidoreductase, partial [Burkholderiaceae bacterium]